MTVSLEIGKFLQKKSVSVFRVINCAYAAFNWVLSVIKKMWELLGSLHRYLSLKYLCNKRLRPSIHCVQLQRKNSRDCSVDGILVFCSFCLFARWIASAKARPKAASGYLKVIYPVTYTFFETFPESSLVGTALKKTKKIGHHSRLRHMMGQSYPIYAFTRANHAHYSSAHVTLCGSSKHTLLK